MDFKNPNPIKYELIVKPEKNQKRQGMWRVYATGFAIKNNENNKMDLNKQKNRILFILK